MEFSRRERPCKVVEAASSSCLRKKSGIGSTGDQTDFINWQYDGIDSICKHGKKGATLFPEPEQGDDENDKLFEIERWSNEDDCMWLSSNCCFPSFTFADYRFSGSWDLSVDDLFVSWLSILENSSLPFGKGISFFDGSGVNPIEEAHLVLDRNLSGLGRVWQEDLEEEEVVMWLQNFVGNEIKYPSTTDPESIESSSEQSLSENSSGFNSSWASLSTHNDSTSSISEFDRTCLWVSLLDLNGEDSQLVSDRESELDESDFPSPSYKTIWRSEIQSYNSNSSSLTEEKYDRLLLDFPTEDESDGATLEGFDANGPLFWPFEHKSDWATELTWDGFCMSPRKNREDTGAFNRLHALRSIRLRLHSRKRDVKDRCKRSLVLSSRTMGSTYSNKDIRRTNTMPSRLSITTEVSMEKVPLETKDEMGHPTNSKVPAETSVMEFDLEDGFSSEEVPIETLLGLNEFNGHEGVDAEFDQDHFTLGDKSLL